MKTQGDIKKVYDKIQALKRTAEDLNRMGADFPALARNTTRILAGIKMLELNVCDVIELDS